MSCAWYLPTGAIPKPRVTFGSDDAGPAMGVSAASNPIKEASQHQSTSFLLQLFDATLSDSAPRKQMLDVWKRLVWFLTLRAGLMGSHVMYRG